MDGPRPAAAAEGPVRRQKASRSSSSGSSSSSEKDIFSTAVVISRQGDVVPAPQREQNSRHHTPHRQRVAVQSSTGTTSVIATVSSSRHAKREHGRKTFASSQLGGGSTIVRGPPLDPVTAHSSPTKPSAPSSPSWSNLNEKSPAGGSAGDLVGFSMVDAASSMTTSRATDDPESGLPSVAHHHHTKGSGHHHSHRHRGRHVPHHSPDEPPSHHSHADGDQHPLADWSAQTHEDGEASSKDTALANTHPRTDSSGGTIFAATPKDPAPIFLRKEDRKACILDDSSSMTDEAYVEHHKLHHVIANLSAALLKQRPEDHVAFSLEWLKRHARVTSAQKSRHQSTRSRRRAADDPDSGKKLEDVNATSIRRMRRRRVNGGDARGSSSRVVSAKSSQLPSRRHSFHVTESATGPSCYSIQEGSQCAPDRSFMFSLSAQPLENSSAPPTGSSGIGSPNTKSVPADMPPQLLSSPASSVATSLARQTTPTTSMGGGDLGATMTISADLSSLSSGAACTNSLPPTESPVGSRGKESLILPTPAIEVSTGELQVSLSSSKTSTIGILRTSAPVAGSDSVSGKPSPVKPVTTEGESGEGDEGEGEDDEWAGMAQFQPVISIDEMTKEVVDHRSFVSPNTSTGASRRPAGGGFAFPTQGPLLSNLVPPTAPASTSSLRPLANVRGATTNASSSQIAAVIVPSTNTTAGLATPNTSSPSFQSPAVAPRNTTFPTGVKPAANNRVSLNTMASTAAAAAEKSINTSIGAVRTSSASTISKGNNQSFLASLANPMSPTYSAGVNVSADLAGLSESLRAMTDVRGGLKVDGKSVLGRSGEENSGSPTGVPPSLRPDVSKSEASSSHAPASPPPVVTVTRSTTLDDRSIHLSTKDGVGATLEGGYRCPCAAAPTATPTPVKRTIVCDSTSSCLSAQVHADVVNRLYQMISELPPSKHAATTVFLEGLLATRSASAPESSLSSSNSTSGVAGVRREALHASTHNAAALLRAAGDATGDVDPDISGDEDADLQMWQPMVASPVHGNKTGHGAIGYDGGAPLVGIVSAGAKGGGDASHSPSVEAIVKDALSQSVLKTLPSTHRPDAGGHANLVNSPTTSTSMRLMPTTNPVTAREDCTPLHADPVVVTSVDALSGNRDPLSAATSEDASPQSVSKMETAVFEVASDGSAAAAKLARSTRDSPVVVGSPSPVEQSSDSEHELGMLSSATQEFDVKGESDLIPSGPPPKSPSQHQAARSQKHSSRRRRRRHSRSREATERVTHANGSSHNSFPVTLSAPSDDGEDWDEWQPTDRSNSEVPHDAGPLGSSYPSHAPTLLPLHSTMILSTTSANSSTMDLPQITCTTEALSDTEGAHVTGEDPSDFPLSLPVKRRSYSRGSTPVSPCADGETSSTRHKRRRRHNPNKSAMDDDLHSSPHRRVSHRISLPRGFSSLFYRSKGRGERRGSLLDAESPQTSFIQERGDSTIPLNVPNSKDSMDDGSMAENSPFQMLSAERRQRRDGEASPTSDSILHQFQKRVLHPNTAPVVIAISQFSTQEHLFVDEVVVLRRALRTIQPFSSMDDTLREMVMRSMTRRVCHLGELVSQQDGPPSVEVGVVVSGTLSVLRDGVVSGTITDGQCVGSTELSQSTECQETIRVEQGSAVLYMISHNYLETLLLLEKDVRRFFFLQYICRDGLLQRLPSSTKVHLADSFRVAQVSAGDSIVVQGATVDSFFFVLSGEATVTAPQHFLAQAESPPMGSEKSSTSHMGDHPVYSHSSILRTPSTSHTPPSLVTRDSLHHRTCGQTIGEVEMCFGYPSLLTIVATTDVVVARLSRLYFNMMVGPQGAEALRMAIACSSIYNHLDCIAPKELRLELLRKRRGAGQRRHSANATTRPGIGVLPNTILRQSASVSGLGALSSYGASDRTASSTRLNGGRGGPSSSRCRTLSPGVTLPPSKATEEMNAAASVTDLDRLSTAPHPHSVHRRSTLHRTIRASDMPGASHGALAATKNGGANIGWKHVSTEGEIVFSGSRNLYRFPAHALRTNNSIMIAVVVDGTIIRWNSIAQRVTGYAPFEVIGQSIFDLLSNEDHKTRMREVLATAKRYAGNWDDYIVEKLERQHIFSFRQNMDLYQVGLALSIIPSNSAASAEVVLLFGRAAKYRAASNYAADVARWLDDSLKPQLRHFQRSVAQLELNDWLVTPDDAMRLRGHLDACLAMVNQFSQFSLLNMETVNESWRPLRLPVLMQKFTVEACSLAQNANCTFYCNAEEVTPRKEIFMDVARVLSVLRMLVTDAIDSSTRDGGRSVAIELHVTSLRPGDTDSRASRGLTASTPAPSSPEPGSTEAFDLPGAVRKPTGFAAAADAPASPPLGPQPIVNPTTHAENVATVTQLEKEVNGTLRQITDLSLRRIRFEMRDNGPSIRDFANGTGPSSPDILVDGFTDTVVASLPPPAPLTSPVGSDSSAIMMPVGVASSKPTQPPARSQRGMNLAHVEQLVSSMGGTFYGFTRPEVDGNIIRMELPLLLVPGGSSAPIEESPEEDEEELNQTAGGPNKGRTFTVILADSNRMQQNQLCQVLWARQHAVVPVKSYKELRRKMEANTADILIVDPLQLIITAEDHAELQGVDPFDDIRDRSSRMVLVVLAGTDLTDWRIQKLLDRNAVIELPKQQGSGALVHIAMQEAERMVTEMREEEERIDLLRRAFSNSAAEGRHKIGRLLGRGAFGEVYEVEDTLTGGRLAMKRMKLKDGVLADTMVQEILAMTSLQHENIIHYFYCEKESDSQLRLYMELASGGTLRDTIRQRGGVGLPFDDIVHHLTDICRGLAYVHSQHYVHADLKSANLLLGTRGRTKIGDFGTAKRLRPREQLYAMAGTPQYMAPEVLNADADLMLGYDYKADIWSLGCIVMEMATGNPPFAHLDRTHGMGMIKYLSELTDAPDLSCLKTGNQLIYKFVKACLQVDPHQRPSAQDLLHLDILQGAVCSNRAECNVKRAAMLYTLNKYAAMREEGEPSAANSNDDDHFHGTDSYASESGSASTYESGSENGSSYTYDDEEVSESSADEKEEDEVHQQLRTRDSDFFSSSTSSVP